MSKSKIKDVIDLANEQFGDGSIMIPELGGIAVAEDYDTISTGCSALDEALGIGGLPIGRIVEIIGQEASGKTTLALHVISNAQKKGLRCALIDAEQAIDRKRAEMIGVDFEKLAISQPDNAEQALDLLDYLIRSKEFTVIVVDSVAALTPRAEIEGEMQDAVIGVQARLMGKIMRKIVAPVNKNHVLVIFTNQVRNKIGGFGFGPQETTPGGNALKFYASIRIDMRRTKNNKRGETLISTQHKITVKKNKMAPPMKTVSISINENGFMNE